MISNHISKVKWAWHYLHRMPGGKWFFSQLLGWVIPYSGTIGAYVEELKPGFAKLVLKDHRLIRNHLNSIHAIALANLGELTSGLALLTGLKEGARGIPIGITIEYFKKARGRLIAVSQSALPEVTENMEFKVYTDICDDQGDIVAKTTVIWRLGLVV